jgi:proteasome accessory factor A
MAEYLRVGTTLLVIDMIEAGEMPPLARVRRPVPSLRAVCADPLLKTTVPLQSGQAVTAIEIQRYYLEACRRFLERRPGAPLEARELVRRWKLVLDELAEEPQALVGTLDWVTKRFILEKSGRGLSWQARKKIDLRYHELSPQGYFQRLHGTGLVCDLLTREEIDHARRNPPTGTPATVRGHYIREFATDDATICANWQAVFLGQANDSRIVWLCRFRPAGGDRSWSTRKRRARRDD